MKIAIYSLLIIILSIAACSNNNHNNNKDIHIESINWSSVPVDGIPFSFNYENYLLIVDSILKHRREDSPYKQIDILFSDSTCLFHTAYFYGHPNNIQGIAFKRFPDISYNKIVLYVYDSSPIISEYYKKFTIELQIFDNKNQLVDKLIVADAAYGEDCYWIRSFELTSDNIIKLIDKDICEKNEDNPSFAKSDEHLFYYEIMDDGKMLRYFTKDGRVEEKNIFPSSEGESVNHLQSGFWQENFPIQQFKLEKDETQEATFICSFGNYQEGKKDGEWIYMYSNELNTYYFPLRGEIYRNGTLIERTSKESDIEKYKLYPKVQDMVNGEE
ncbi:MAG: hypothetical protein FWF54_01010 [Candidatus Azobacteroides sp.]|nr:hypothetical protein [Candidatus Azobacteroides sp.]